MRVTRLKVMVDYGAFPVWNISPDGYGGMVRGERLPISDDLRRDLQRWCDDWDELVYPTIFDESLTDEAAEAASIDTGRELARRLARELPDVEIVYWPGGPEDQEVIKP